MISKEESYQFYFEEERYRRLQEREAYYYNQHIKSLEYMQEYLDERRKEDIREIVNLIELTFNKLLYEL